MNKIKMEVELHDEADHEPACGAIESVFIKEEVVEDEGTDEVSTLQKLDCEIPISCTYIMEGYLHIFI